jgi:hypothetical protein
MGECAFGRQPTLDQPVWCRGLADARVTTPAGVFGPDGDNDLEPGWDNIQSFRTIFADLDHVGATARAYLVLGLDHLFDPRPPLIECVHSIAGQRVIRQMAKIALGRRSPRFAVGIADDTGINCGFGDGRLKVFKSQLARVRIQLFGRLAVKGMAQFGDEVILPFSLRYRGQPVMAFAEVHPLPGSACVHAREGASWQ